MIKLNLPDTKYNINYTSAMKKDLKRAEKRGYDMKEIAEIIFKLANDEPLEERYPFWRRTPATPPPNCQFEKKSVFE